MRQPLTGAAGPPAEDGEQDPDVAAEAAEVQALAQHRTGRSGYVNIILYAAVVCFCLSPGVLIRYVSVCGGDSCTNPFIPAICLFNGMHSRIEALLMRAASGQFKV